MLPQDLYAYCLLLMIIDQMYLQLRSDLVGDQFSCSTEQALHFGALAVHVEYPGGLLFMTFRLYTVHFIILDT